MKYSVIIPVYNRPDECDELLESLCRQTEQDFEVVVVEDGSQIPCEEVVSKYADRLKVRYYTKPNSGPGQTRNYGVERAEGEYVLILDSDVVLPEGYMAAVSAELAATAVETGSTGRPCEAFGGPDRAHDSFTDVQKAINYGMTSFFTTGGIRGGSSSKSGAALDKFFPRSFNMGVRRDVYGQLGGFSKMRFGEDVDFSYRLVESGARCRLFPSAWVYHKRRANFRQFFKQVHNSGIARINLTKRHPGTLKLVHMLPTAFTLGVAMCLLAFIVGQVLVAFSFFIPQGCILPHPEIFLFGWSMSLVGLLPLLLYAVIISVDSTMKNHSVRVGLLSIIAAFVQLTGYGTGFLRCWWQRCVLGRGEFEAFKKNFYK